MRDWQVFIQDLFARFDGPLHFRFIFQPLMAITFAVIDGVKDAKAGKPAYFWALLSTSGSRKDIMKEGWKSVGRIFILAIILDVIYQMKVHGSVFAGQLLIVAFVLAIVPYLILRGPVNRIARLIIARIHKDVAVPNVADVGPRHG
jgi:hypothetical protein